MKSYLTRMFSTMGAMVSFAMFSLLLVIFFIARFNEKHQITITINIYNEMNVESVVFTIFWAMAVFSLVYIIRRNLKK